MLPSIMEQRFSFRRNPDKKRRRVSKLTIPEHVAPYVKLVFAEMRRQGVTYDQVEEGSGVLRSTLKAWRHKNKPGLDSIEVVFGFLGWSFVPLPNALTLPPEIAAELQTIADKLGLDMPEAIANLVAIAAGKGAALPGKLLPLAA